MNLFALLVLVIVLGVIYWAVHRLAGAFGLPAPVLAILDVVLVLVFVWALLGMAGWAPPLRWR